MTGGQIVHGHARRGQRSQEHRIWLAMKNRCSNPRNTAFPNYGGRGISVCQRWRDSFESFLEDMGPRPSPQHSLDRINNEGNYEPGNVRWSTTAEQHANMRTNVRVRHEGVTLTIAEWAKRLGASPYSLYHRIRRGKPLVDEPGSRRVTLSLADEVAIALERIVDLRGGGLGADSPQMLSALLDLLMAIDLQAVADST